MASDYTLRTLRVNGLHTRFAEAGVENDKTVIMLHSGEFGATCETSWEHNIGRFAEEYHVIAPDLLGWGGSSKVFDHADPFDLRVRHLQDLLRTLDIDDAHWVGHSLGGGYIASMAAESKDVWGMDKLVLAHGGGGVPQGLGKILKEFDGSAEKIEEFLHVLFYDQWWDDDYVEWKRELAHIPGHWECIAAIVFDPPFEVESESRRMRTADTIENDTLIVAGKQDELKPPEQMEAFADEIGPNARLEFFDESKHGAQIEHQERFNDLALEFLAQ